MVEKYKILIVDDESINRTVLEAVLTENGFEVIQANDGAEGLKLAQSENPDMIILDVMMPVLDGFAVCEQLRANEETCAIPIIFITVLDNRFSILRALRAGATDYIIKPIESEDLLNKIEQLFKTQNLIRDKLNLMKINEALVTKIKSMLQQFSVLEKVDGIKSDLAENSLSTLDCLNTVRESIERFDEDSAMKALSMAELSLQFTDRVSQQLNEFAKLLDHIQLTMTRSNEIVSHSYLDKASTDSVLYKQIAQKEVDDLLQSLNE
jgi:CheY-like chemotaxis protein